MIKKMVARALKESQTALGPPTLEEMVARDSGAWVYAVGEMQSGDPGFFASLIRRRIPQPEWVAEMLADWIVGATKLPPRRRSRPLDIDPVDLLKLRNRFTEMRLSGKAEELVIDTLHHETGIAVSTLRKYVAADPFRIATKVSRIRKKPCNKG